MAIECRTIMTERVVQKNKQRSKASFFAWCLFVKIFLCKFGALAYEVNIKSIVVRWQKRWQKALEERIFYIIAVITTIFKQLKYKRLKIVRSELITSIM